MIRQVIQIDEEKCNGCGICAMACHEGAIGIVNGKAKLLRDDYCDGMGDCLPGCPLGAISFIEREAAAYDEAAVMENKRRQEILKKVAAMAKNSSPGEEPETAGGQQTSRLQNWPVQIKLTPIQSPNFRGAKMLIAADCTAYAYGAFHQEFVQGRTVLIGCPKLDAVEYGEKLTEIFRENDIQSVTLVRMQVPCCGGLQRAVSQAIEASGKALPLETVIVSTQGEIVSRT